MLRLLAAPGMGKAPDVALNQPKHWTIRQKANDPMDGSCRIFAAEFHHVGLS